MVICGSSRRSSENPGLRNSSAASVSKYYVDTSYSTKEAGRSAACCAHAPARAAANSAGRIAGQSAVQRGVRRDGGEADLIDDSQAVELGRGLDDPGQHQRPEHLIGAGDLVETERVVGPRQRIGQVPGLGTDDGQRPTRRNRGAVVEAELQLGLPTGQSLPGSCAQRFDFSLVVAGADVLDPPGPSTRRPHDLHPGGPRRRLHGPQVGHRTTLWPPLSAHIRTRHAPNPQVHRPRRTKITKSEQSQVLRRERPGLLQRRALRLRRPYVETPVGSLYEWLGETCGGRQEDATPGSCD